jgi:signal transduction histidine kinase
MIDASLLEIDELRIKKEKCNLDKMMQQIYHYHNIDKHKMGKDHLALLLNQYKNDGSFIIYTDPFRLTQVISGLLQNALKFTHKGIIEFGYVVKPDNKLQFFVKDSGKGILAEKAAAIFDKFEKLDEHNRMHESGLGLGLTLAKGIINLLGGEIWVERNVFKGSTFNFTIDYQECIQSVAEKRILQSILV